MKIVKKGVDPSLQLFRHECNNCKTIFEFIEWEAIQKYDQRDGNFLEINCPVCRKLCFHNN